MCEMEHTGRVFACCREAFLELELRKAHRAVLDAAESLEALRSENTRLRRLVKEMVDKKYSVWVGGVEVNDHYLTAVEAAALAFEYVRDGYDDVVVREEKEDEGHTR